MKKLKISFVIFLLVVNICFASEDFYLVKTSSPQGKLIKSNKLVLTFSQNIKTSEKDLKNFISLATFTYSTKIYFKKNKNQVIIINNDKKWVKGFYLRIEKYDFRSRKYLLSEYDKKLCSSVQLDFYDNPKLIKQNNYFKKSSFKIVKIVPSEDDKFTKKKIIYFSSEPAGNSEYIAQFIGTDPPRFTAKIKKIGKKVIVYTDGGSLIVNNRLADGEYLIDKYGNKLRTKYEFIYRQ